MKSIIIVLICSAICFIYGFKSIPGIIAIIAMLAYFAVKFIPAYYKQKSLIKFNEGDFAESKALYKKALKRIPNNFAANMEYVHILLRTGDFEEAQQVVDTLLSRPLDSNKRKLAVLQRCMCYYKNNNLDEAYEDACELYNDGYRSITLYSLLGYFKILKAPLAQDTFDFCLEAYDYANDARDIGDNLLICYYNRGEYEKAKEISDTIIEESPKFVEAWYHAAQIDYAMRDYKSAKEKLDKIPECNRSNMTTIPEEDVDELLAKVNDKLKENN